ncbi:unnamed protein product [Candida verbasci]|uniref:Uncharacterized protein n=1 Tax=Candida verbasci TaxID=1227364 RepID=A0A9W4U1F9_9ASCO|nr:unnamed protein product [Candida verbasci]
MTIREIYIARHGYRSNWLPPPHPPNPTGIDSDPPLAPHGVEQAKQLAAFLTSLPIKDKPQFIISSPFYRCIETSKPIAQMLDLKVAIDRGVGEWFQKSRNVIPIPANYDELNHFFGNVLINEDIWPRDNLHVIPNDKGETNEEVFERCKLFWLKFIPAFEAKFPDIENILIVTHAATKIALGSALLKLKSITDYIDDNITLLRAGACSLSKYSRIFESDDYNWKIVMNGNCEFLTKGEEMNWNFTINVEAGSDEDIKRRKKEEEEQQQQAQQSSNSEEAPTTELAHGSELDGNEDEFDVRARQSFYITVDIPNYNNKYDDDDHNGKNQPKIKRNVIKPSANFQFTDLKESHPLIKLSNNRDTQQDVIEEKLSTKRKSKIVQPSDIIDGRIYETSWNKIVGTELIFDEYGELIGKVEEHIVADPTITFKNKSANDINVDNNDEVTNKNGDFRQIALKRLEEKNRNQN